MCLRWDSGHLVILVFAKSAREARTGEDGGGEERANGRTKKNRTRGGRKKRRARKKDNVRRQLTTGKHDEKMK